MSIEERIEVGPHLVHYYLLCDGPSCEEAVLLDAGRAADSWHLIEDKYAPSHVWPHFCSWGCVAAWATAKATEPDMQAR